MNHIQARLWIIYEAHSFAYDLYMYVYLLLLSFLAMENKLGPRAESNGKLNENTSIFSASAWVRKFDFDNKINKWKRFDGNEMRVNNTYASGWINKFHNI